jgi:ABC-type branched-subunit amino acid transport system substrate-binding protein
MRRTTRPLALVLLLGVLVAGCGTQVDPDIRRQAADALLSGGGGDGGGGTAQRESTDAELTEDGQPLDGESTSVDVNAGTSGGGSAAAADGSGAEAGGAAADGAAVAAPAPAGGNGGATDVGVTGNEITIGTVASLSGPIPGLFEGAVNGTNAYVKYVNSQGGIYGRKLKVVVGDDQNECGANQNRYRDLSPKVFAFVGGFSVFDECSARVMKPQPKVPMVQYALSAQANAMPNLFSPQASVPGYATGPFEYWNAKYGDKTKKVGTVYSQNAAAAESHRAISAAAKSVGWNFIYERGAASTEQDFTADIVRMRQDGVEIVFLMATTAQNAARIKRAADSQGFQPIWIVQVAYDQSFITFMGGAESAEGVEGANLFSLYFGEDEGKRIPEVARYQEWMKRNNPKANLDVFSMYGWTSAKLFVQALRDAGPKATRAGLLQSLQKVKEYDADGMLAPSGPAAKKPATCYVLWQIRGGKYVRVDTPARGYRCDGKYYNHKP